MGEVHNCIESNSWWLTESNPIRMALYHATIRNHLDSPTCLLCTLGHHVLDDILPPIKQTEARDMPACRGNGHHNWSFQRGACECGELKAGDLDFVYSGEIDV